MHRGLKSFLRKKKKVILSNSCTDTVQGCRWFQFDLKTWKTKPINQKESHSPRRSASENYNFMQWGNDCCSVEAQLLFWLPLDPGRLGLVKNFSYTNTTLLKSLPCSMAYSIWIHSNFFFWVLQQFRNRVSPCRAPISRDQTVCKRFLDVMRICPFLLIRRELSRLW